MASIIGFWVGLSPQRLSNVKGRLTLLVRR
jgi:hypothetical protein